jgi:hypothetical protein
MYHIYSDSEKEECLQDNSANSVEFFEESKRVGVRNDVLSKKNYAMNQEIRDLKEQLVSAKRLKISSVTILLCIFQFFINFNDNYNL